MAVSWTGVLSIGPSHPFLAQNDLSKTQIHLKHALFCSHTLHGSQLPTNISPAPWPDPSPNFLPPQPSPVFTTLLSAVRDAPLAGYTLLCSHTCLLPPPGCLERPFWGPHFPPHVIPSFKPSWLPQWPRHHRPELAPGSTRTCTCWDIGSWAAAGRGGARGEAVGGRPWEALAGRQGVVEAGREAAAGMQHRGLF